jgi:hypothetical protein
MVKTTSTKMHQGYFIAALTVGVALWRIVSLGDSIDRHPPAKPADVDDV